MDAFCSRSLYYRLKYYSTIKIKKISLFNSKEAEIPKRGLIRLFY